MKRSLAIKRILTTIFLGSTLCVSAEADKGDKGSNNAALAKEILADPSLREVHQMAQNLLKTGLTAGSGYGEVWIRDLNTFIEVALKDQ